MRAAGARSRASVAVSGASDRSKGTGEGAAWSGTSADASEAEVYDLSTRKACWPAPGRVPRAGSADLASRRGSACERFQLLSIRRASVI